MALRTFYALEAVVQDRGPVSGASILDPFLLIDAKDAVGTPRTSSPFLLPFSSRPLKGCTLDDRSGKTDPLEVPSASQVVVDSDALMKVILEFDPAWEAASHELDALDKDGI